MEINKETHDIKLQEKQFFDFAIHEELTVHVTNHNNGFSCFAPVRETATCIHLVTQKGEHRVFKSLDSFYNVVQKYNNGSVRIVCRFFGETK